MIAWAKAAIACLVASRADARWGSVATILFTGRATPIMPVDEGKISLGRSCSSRANSRQTCWQARIPALPIAQLALPEFTISARIRPRLAFNDARPISRGAATTRFLVKTAAAVVPAHASTRARSGRPLALIPAQAAEKLNPAGWPMLSEELRLRRTRAFILRSSPASWLAEEAWRTWAIRRAPWR